MSSPHRGRAATLTPRPTMVDVARDAGVSTATVSYVVNERVDAGISAPTRQRVQAAIDRLGYRPDLHARALRNRHTRTIGLITDEIAVHPAGGQTIAGLHDRARQHGSLPLLVHAAGESDELRAVVDDLLDRRVDALVYAVAGTRAVEDANSFRHVPTVLLNCFTSGGSLPCVLPAEEAGGRTAASVALDAGHRRLAYLGGWPESWATVQRVKGFRSALRRASVRTSDTPVLAGNFRSDSGYDLTREVLRRRRRPTALVCGNDLMAVGAYFALKEAGLRIPDDVSVVGYDDQEDISSFLHPALTTIRLPYYEMGAMAADALLDDAVLIPRRIDVTCPPVIRSSVAPPPS